MYWVYVLKSQIDNNRYVGFASHLARRLDNHHRGLVPSTSYRRPLILIHSEQYSSREEAINREKYLKSGIGREYLDFLQL